MSLVYARGGEIKEGDKLINFVLQNGLTKKSVDFDNDIKGKSKYTAIIFANTACSACRREMQTLSALSAKYEDLTTYVILVDMRGADIVEAYDEQFKLNVTYLLDPEFTQPPIYNFDFTPSLLIVDHSGKIVFKKGGYNTGKDEELLTLKVWELVK